MAVLSKLSTTFFTSAALLTAVAYAQGNPADLETLYQRRLPFIVQAYPVTGGDAQLSGWINTLTAAGQWPDVNYATGCSAQRANWPAQFHWLHMIPLAAAYTDVLPTSGNVTGDPPYDFAGNATVASLLDTTMNWWFTNDFTNDACIDQGGLANNTCPCGTAGMWNTNWYSNVILIPRLASQTALLLNDTITPAQRSAAVHMVERGATTFGRFVYGLGYITGANTLDIASNVVNAGILDALAGNQTGYDLIDQAFDRVHNEVVIQDAIKADGIRRDGSFGQHVGILYNGNYGKDYANLILGLEVSAAGTKWAAGTPSKVAFSKHIDGSAWMVYRNTKTGVSHWDFNTVGRFISFAVSDKQATAALNINFTSVQQLGQAWGYSNISSVASSLLAPGSSVNAGGIVGNRMFYNNDYMVQRGENYVTTVKMLSTRTGNTECINSQNPFGFHLGQGGVFNYVHGNEYDDTAAAWDWSLVPGITTDYAATPLLCNFTQWSGNKTFVGGASDGKVGVAAMDYINPYTGAFSYRKAWFFLPDDVQHVIVSGINKSSSGAGVYHVLDQKRANGDVFVDGAVATSTKAGAKSLWHDGVGYTFDTSSNSALQSLQFSTPQREMNWKTIGTSAAPNSTITMFQAYLEHNPSKLSQAISYSVYPATSSASTFVTKAKKRPVWSVASAGVSAAMDSSTKTIMAVFWSAGKVTVPTALGWSVEVSVTQPATVIVNTESWTVTVADPSQSLQQVSVRVQAIKLVKPKCLSVVLGKKVNVQLPQGGDAGKSVGVSLC